MRTAIYLGKENIKLEKTECPHISPNDVLIKNINASICGSDVAVFKNGTVTGHKISIGEKFGHEMVSKVVEVGENVKDIKKGQRVYPYPVFAADNASKAGSLGGFTEYLLIKNAQLNRELYLVPDEIQDKVAALIEPFTVATRAVKRANPKSGEYACVYGTGTIGIAAAFALKYFGCEKIMLVDHSDFRLNLAKEFGFRTVNSKNQNLKEEQLNYFGKALSLSPNQPNINISIDAVGVPEILEQYLQSKVIDSRFVLLGVDNSKKDIDLLSLIFSSQSLIGSGGYRPSDVQTVFEILEENQSSIEKMVTKVYPWEKLIEALETASNPMNAMNVQIKY